MKRTLIGWSAVALLATAAACTKSSPARPTETGAAEQTATVVDATTGVTLTTPTPMSPAAGASVRFADQPVTLTVRNAATSGTTALTYTFQVASDSAFAGIVTQKENVTEGSGQTSITLDRLTGGRTYFWRVRANSGSVAGLFTTPRQLRSEERRVGKECRREWSRCA